VKVQLIMKRLLYLIAFWPATLVHAQHCRIAGQIFFADEVDRTITLRTDSDDLVNFSYDNATSFLRSNSSADRIPPEELNNGDRLCVGTSEPVVVTVTPRTEINAEQKKELAAWQADSLYGVVSALDTKARRITLAVSTGNKEISVSVDVSPNAAYWIFPRNAASLSDSVAGSLDRISSGDTLYVRGTKRAAGQSFVANLIVSGGVRSFAATIEPTDPSDDLLHVRLVLSGNMRTVHIAFGEFYAIGRAAGASTGKARRLYRMSVADLQRGDTVLILGIDQGDGSLHACALIAGFSPFGVLPPDPSQQMRWIFDNVALGYAYPATPSARSKP
jgi:hypothetical protein